MIVVYYLALIDPKSIESFAPQRYHFTLFRPFPYRQDIQLG